jgi:hypothetical protein
VTYTTQHSIIAHMAGLPPRPNFAPAPAAPAPVPQSNEVKVTHCVEWLKGACPRGEDCRYHHDPRLDPNLRNLKGPQIPSGPTCRRCADLQRPCDKQGRGGLDDPCSECRWYGGENSKCVIYPPGLNDVLWNLMTTRVKQGFNLPEFRARDYFNFSHGMGKGKDGKPPKPMPTSALKNGWVGETQEQLKVKDDMLSSDMRKNPRKYLDPPALSKRELGKDARMEKIQKRAGSPVLDKQKKAKTSYDKQARQDAKLAADLPTTNTFGLPVKPVSNAFGSFSATQYASAGNFPPAALNGRPSMQSARGVSWAETITWSYSNSRWVATTWCEPGSLAQCVPPQPVEDLQCRPVRHSRSGAATFATWSYVTRRWTIKWEDDTSTESAQYGQSVLPVALGQVLCFSVLCTSHRQYINIHLVRSCPTSSGYSTSSTPAAYRSSGRSSGNTSSCPCGHSSGTSSCLYGRSFSK